LTITVSGNSVSGTYVDNQGRISGTLSADGRTITGRWSEAPSYEPPEDQGGFTLTLSPDAQSLSGWWFFGEGTGRFDISGTRIR
jgi:hypothetical protein